MTQSKITHVGIPSVFLAPLSLLDCISSSANWRLLLVIMEILFFRWKSEMLFSYKC